MKFEWKDEYSILKWMFNVNGDAKKSWACFKKRKVEHPCLVYYYIKDYQEINWASGKVSTVRYSCLGNILGNGIKVK